MSLWPFILSAYGLQPPFPFQTHLVFRQECASLPCSGASRAVRHEGVGAAPQVAGRNDPFVPYRPSLTGEFVVEVKGKGGSAYGYLSVSSGTSENRGSGSGLVGCRKRAAVAARRRAAIWTVASRRQPNPSRSSWRSSTRRNTGSTQPVRIRLCGKLRSRFAVW